jgi:hypothetical protein
MPRIAALALAALSALAASVARADPAAEAAQSYRIETAGTTTELPAGGAGTFVLAIVPAEKIHVHPQAPLRVVVEARGLELAKRTLGRGDAVDPKAEGPRFEVPFVAPAAGGHELTARLQFFVCSDRWCVKQARDVRVAVTAK